jgi:hypothetical protein
VVPHVPVCMYAHVREGDMHIAERVRKKTGTKWDRDQTSCITVAGQRRAEENDGDASFDDHLRRSCAQNAQTVIPSSL